MDGDTTLFPINPKVEIHQESNRILPPQRDSDSEPDPRSIRAEVLYPPSHVSNPICSSPHPAAGSNRQVSR
ncbi:hypothetical protein JTE90_026283 [Oedothorax gibbosus]|uniref:Engrailed n=1 Tax=Oedothorax gibbosus TaxID=931172 RepID=A0AAV6U2V2_9ARAC|nr:hypothetical protein JTE90_026283 [Oedothorax gibbosus]